MKKENLELIVRKRKSTFLERLLQFFGYDFSHDRYKGIIYSELNTETEQEEMIKKYYDAYSYLLSNYRNVFTTEIFKRFVYLIEGKEIKDVVGTRICNLYNTTADLPNPERAIKFHVLAYYQLPELEENTRYAVSLMLFNYALAKGSIPTVSMTRNQYKLHREALSSFEKDEFLPLFDLLKSVVRNAKVQQKSYYKNLSVLSTEDVCNRIFDDYEMLTTQHKIESVSLYGSFSKNKQRIDSDIDIMIVFQKFVPEDEKQKTIEYLSQHYFDIFHRHIDISEVSSYLSDSMLKETNKQKTIFKKGENRNE